MRADLMGMPPKELEAWCVEQGQGAFRAKQLRRWLNLAAQPDEMTDLPTDFRKVIAACAQTAPARIERELVSEKDDTRKYLFALEDGNLVEGVFMRYKHGNTLCLSTQVGCRMGCLFCASTLEGLVRNLTAGEMLCQVALINRMFAEGERRGVTNVVLMGSGEPLDNYENVVAFLRLLTSKQGLGISARNVSLSTCGLVEGIDRLAGEGFGVNLCLSLHAPNDELRARIMPVAKSAKLADVLAACGRYLEKTGRRLIFEYALIGGLNDGKEHALELASLLRGMQCHVNLIPLNPVPERDLAGCSPAHAHEFAGYLADAHISATVRRELGTDIQGACGQLRRRALDEET